jgi:AraC-like DNA-binding protein
VEQILRAPWDLLYLAAGDRPLHTAPFQGWRLALDQEQLCRLVVERSGHRLSPGRCRRRLLSSHALHLRSNEAQALGTALRQQLLLTQGLRGASLEALISAGIEGLLLELIGQLLCGDLIATARQQRPSARSSKVQIVDDLLQWIHTHLDQPIQLADLEAQSGYSQRSLRNIFHERFGCGPVQWIRLQRLELARRQLLSPAPGATVSAVAAACGYDHLSQFSRDFRAAHGQRPSELLREGRRGQPA